MRIPDLVKAYIEKYSVLRTRLLEIVSDGLPSALTYTVPPIRTVLKSFHLNSFVSQTYKNILIIYSILHKKAEDLTASETRIKTEVTALKSQLGRLENKYTKYLPSTGSIIDLDYRSISNTQNSAAFMLRPLTMDWVSSSEIESLEEYIYPVGIKYSKYPTETSVKDILFESGSANLHYQITASSYLPISTIYENITYTGIVIKLRAKFIRNVCFNNLFINFLPGNYKILSVNGIEYNKNATSKSSFLFPTAQSYLEIVINVPFPTIGKYEENITIEDIEALIYNIPITSNNKILTNQLESIFVKNNNDQVYKYKLGIYNIKLSSEEYHLSGRLASNVIYTRFKPNLGIALHTNHYLPESTYIYYVINTDIYKELLIPSTVNGIKTFSYDLPNRVGNRYDTLSEAGNCYNILNGTLSSNIRYNKSTVNNIGYITSLNKITKHEIFTQSASLPYIALLSAPISIQSIKVDTLSYTQVFSISELKDYTSAAFYLMGNTILLNKTQQGNKDIVVEYTRGPQYFTIDAYLVTEENNISPELYNSYIETYTIPSNINKNNRTDRAKRRY